MERRTVFRLAVLLTCVVVVLMFIQRTDATNSKPLKKTGYRGKPPKQEESYSSEKNKGKQGGGKPGGRKPGGGKPGTTSSSSSSEENDGKPGGGNNPPRCNDCQGSGPCKPCEGIDSKCAPDDSPNFNCDGDQDSMCATIRCYLKKIVLRLIDIIDGMRDKLLKLKGYLEAYKDELNNASCEDVLCAVLTCLQDLLTYLCLYY
ncbi:uncharacterized protein [Ptychodera flava]|uniref:uncharacterized protein isoform X2 n=1 Tax=Ptychodera flava TaxID=63121 RepID=UPI00396AAF5C